MTVSPQRVLLSVVVFLAPIASWAQADGAFVGRVVKVIDGDTVTLLVNERKVKVRLAEIDAPERDQPWGVQATDALSEKVLRQKVSVQPSGADDGRILGRIFIASRDINREMIRDGHAWAYRKYLVDETLIGDEDHAKVNSLGLWSLPESDRMPPWEWRHGGKGMPSKVDRPQVSEGLSCGSKRYCKEMNNCAEALFYLKECGLSRLDADSDGVPCEDICP